jgi:hypothetical protein
VQSAKIRDSDQIRPLPAIPTTGRQSFYSMTSCWQPRAIGGPGAFMIADKVIFLTRIRAEQAARTLKKILAPGKSRKSLRSIVFLARYRIIGNPTYPGSPMAREAFPLFFLQAGRRQLSPNRLGRESSIQTLRFKIF